MKQTANYKFNLPDDSDNIEISELNKNFTKTDELIADLESENAAAHSEISNLQSGKADKAEVDKIAAPTYTESAQRVNLTSGEKLSVAFGKIKKWFSDLKSVAFTGKYTDLSGVPEKFEPEEHTHTKSDITDFPAALKNPSSLTLTVNGSSSSYNGSSAVSKSFYAPTTSGTSGYELVSSGSGAPVWKPPNYAVCNTAGSTAAKTVSISNFKLVKGARVLIKFTYAHKHMAQSATLNVSGTGAKPIKYFGRVVYGYKGTHPSGTTYYAPNTWEDDETVEFVYDGTEWIGTANKIPDPSRIIVGSQNWVSSNASGASNNPNSYNMRFCDFMCYHDSDNSDDSEVLQKAINSTMNNETMILMGYEYVLRSPVALNSSDPSSYTFRIIIEGTHAHKTSIRFRDNGCFISENRVGGAVNTSLTLRNIVIDSNTVKSIISLTGDESTEIILDNVEITFTGDDFGEFYPLVADKVVMKNCKYTVNCNAASGYMCWSGIDCKTLQVDDSTITLINNSSNTINPDGFELNFIYNTEVKGYIRNSVLSGSGKYRTNFTNGQIKFEDCDITLGANASLCHYTTDDERKYSILRDCFISYSNSTYLTFGKVTGCTFKNTTNTNWATDKGKLQILCPTQMTNNTFIGRSEMNFNENKVLFADNVLQYAQSYTSFPAGSVNANTMISG